MSALELVREFYVALEQKRFKNKIYLYQLRFFLFRQLEKNKIRKSSKKTKWSIEFFRTVIFLLKLFFFLFSGIDAIFVEHGREYKNKSGKYIDPFFESIKCNKRYDRSLIISSTQKTYTGFFSELFSNNIILPKSLFIGASLITGGLIGLFSPKLRVEVISPLLNLGVGKKAAWIQLFTLLGGNIVSRIVCRAFRPKEILVTDFYNTNGVWIYAAKYLGVPSYEVQHGHINSQHWGYVKFKDEVFLQLCPDFIIVFSSAWKPTVMNMGWNVLCSINDYFMYKDTIKNKITENGCVKVLMIAQPSVWEFQKKIISKIKCINPNVDIIIRAHPKMEVKNIDDEFKFSNKFIELVDDVVSHDIILGCFSTALIEAKLLGKVVIAVYDELVPLGKEMDDFNIRTVHYSELNNIEFHNLTSMAVENNPPTIEEFLDV